MGADIKAIRFAAKNLSSYDHAGNLIWQIGADGVYRVKVGDEMLEATFPSKVPTETTACASGDSSPYSLDGPVNLNEPGRPIGIYCGPECQWDGVQSEARMAMRNAVTIGEEAAFLEWWGRGVPEKHRPEWDEFVLSRLRSGEAGPQLVAARDAWQAAISYAVEAMKQ